MSMKYKLLLCVVVLLAFSATLFAGTVQIYKQNFQDDSAVKYSTWTLQGQWAVLSDVSTKPGIPAKTGPAGLVYNKNGDYEQNISGYYATTAAISCSGYTSVVLSFARSLTIEDSYFDKATVQVANTAGAWTTVYTNPTTGASKASENIANLTDASWHTVSYDISTVADNKSTVFIRWGIASNGNNTNGGGATVANLHGWAIDDVVLSGAGPDAFYGDATLSGTALPDGFAASGPLWEIGPPSVGTSGQTRDADGDPATPATVTVGRDPATTASGSTTDSIIGTVIGDNYPAGMSAAGTGDTYAPQYLTWGPLDLTGLQKSALTFQQWLNIGAGSLDKVGIQIHVNNTALDNPDDPETVLDKTSSSTINIASPKAVTAVSTANHYAQGDPPANNGLKVTFKYDTDGLADGNTEALRLQYTLDNSAATPVWVTFSGGTITANTDDSVDSGVVKVTFDSTAFASVADYTKAQNNANFAVRAVVSKNDAPTYSALADGSTAAAIISEVKVVGVLWTNIYTNPTGSETLADIGDGNAAWSLKNYDLSSYGANGNKAVWVRWFIGNTDSGFDTEYGGWSIDAPQILEASRSWAAGSMTVPAGLQWSKTGAVTVPAKNTGTATWDSSFKLYEVKGAAGTPDNPGEPGAKLKTTVLGLGPITRWNVGSVAVSGTVAPDASFSFGPSVTAPPMSSVVYAIPMKASDPADATLSVLPATWDMANKTADASIDWLPTYRSGSIASKGIAISRFPDDGPGSYGNWAWFWTEELAGRVPMVVAGYPDGTYQPAGLVTRDQIAVYIARAMMLDYVGKGKGTMFSDVPTDYWAVDAIEAVGAAGVISGYPDRTYHPTDNVTRDQMAKFIAKGAGLTIVAKTAATKADQDAAIKAGWFPDVPIWDDPATSANERNVFADYINTLSLAQIVLGYPAKDPADSSKTIYYYKPADKVDRSQLAVYVWRGFMRDDASVVVLGGPAFTAVALGNGVADYYGYSPTGSTITDGPFVGTKAYSSVLLNGADAATAYVTLDAVRLAGNDLATLLAGDATTGLDVTFTLTPVKGASVAAVSSTVSIPLATVQAWAAAVIAPTASGEPYRNVVWAIPTGLQGDYTLVVSVEGDVISRQPAIAIRNGIYAEQFDDLGMWTTSGQPVTPGPKIYPGDYIASGDIKTVADANAKLFKDGASVELQKTQAIPRAFDTSNRHNIRLGLRYAQAGLGSSESLKIEYSLDYVTKGTSAAWKTIATVTGSAVPTALQDDPVYFSLANGDPNADPVVLGADNCGDFAIRLSANISGSGKVYFDTLTIDGT